MRGGGGAEERRRRRSETTWTDRLVPAVDRLLIGRPCTPAAIGVKVASTDLEADGGGSDAFLGRRLAGPGPADVTVGQSAVAAAPAGAPFSRKAKCVAGEIVRRRLVLNTVKPSRSQ